MTNQDAETEQMLVDARKREADAREKAYKKRLEQKAPKSIENAFESLNDAINSLHVYRMRSLDPDDCDIESLKRFANQVQYKLMQIDSWKKLQKLRLEGASDAN